MATARSSQKRITKEAIVLRFMRQARNLSLNKAGRLVGITGSAIAHIEGGRMEVSQARIETMIRAYGFTREEYFDLFEGKDLPINLRDECTGIIKQLDGAKLQAVHAVLINFLPPGSARSGQSQGQTRTLSRT